MPFCMELFHKLRKLCCFPFQHLSEYPDSKVKRERLKPPCWTGIIPFSSHFSGNVSAKYGQICGLAPGTKDQHKPEQSDPDNWQHTWFSHT